MALGDTSITTGLEDEFGNVGILTVDALNRPGIDALSSQSIVAIRQPLFALAFGQNVPPDEEARGHILVQQLSDLVFLPRTDAWVPTLFRTLFKDANKQALKCKEEGNQALKNGELVRALERYTEGISSSEDSSLTKDLIRNRSLVQLRLSRFDVAMTDAVASLLLNTDSKSKNLDGKAYYRGELAAYQLGSFKQAGVYFAAHLDLEPGDRDSARQLARTTTRMAEQTGMYKFERVIAALSPSEPRVEATDFVQQVETRESPGKGRGLFSKISIKIGEVVLREKATGIVYSGDERANSTLKIETARMFGANVKTGASHRVLLKKLHDNPSLVPKIAGLFAGLPISDTTMPVIRIVDNLPVLDFFHIHEILHYNAFRCGVVRKVTARPFPHTAAEITEGGVTGIGIWSVESSANHSCIGNASHYFLGDLIIMRATKDISPGDEITISYKIPVEHEDMQAELKDAWAFTCTCHSYAAEQKTSMVKMKARNQHLEEGSALAKQRPSAANDIAKLIRKIEQTYDIGTKPSTRPAMLTAYELLFAAQMVQRNHEGAANSLIEWLGSCGYGVEVGTENVVLDRSFAISCPDIVNSLVLISQHKRLARKYKMAAEFDRLAKVFYHIYNGSIHGFEHVMPLRST